MKQTHQRLTAVFLGILFVAVAIVVLFETDCFPEGLLAGNNQLEFLCVTILELITIAAIPLSLRLFRFAYVRQRLTSADALRRWGTARLLMLGIPLIADATLYELFLNVACGYLAIMAFLSMFFIVPTLQRCQAEIEQQ